MREIIRITLFIKGILFFIIFFVFFVGSFFLVYKYEVFASSTDGTIDSSDKYAWGENIGWVSFGTSEGDVGVTDAYLSGYAWGENIGWISLNCSNDSSCGTVDYGIANDGEGSLSGYAWGENIGWIDFDPTYGGVTINSSGEFLGSAWGENIGWIVFNCATTDSCVTVDYKVKTDWRPQSERPACNNSLDDDSDGETDYPDDPGCDSLTDTNETDSTPSPAGGGSSSNSGGGGPIALFSSIFWGNTAKVEETAEETQDTNNVVIEKDKNKPSFFDDVVSLFDRNTKNIDEVVQTEDAPEVFIPEKFTNLPQNVRFLINKFPSLGETFTRLSIDNIDDLERLSKIKLSLPNLKELSSIPSEIVFARSRNKLIDYNLSLRIEEDGLLEQQISSIAGQTVELTVRPETTAKKITGYLVFKERKQVKKTLPLDFSLAAALFAVNDYKNIVPTTIEDEFLIGEFEYTDHDNDGIYTANLQAPQVAGVYKIITVIDYFNDEIASKELHLTILVDPEGYIYEDVNGKQLRIPDATVSIFWENPDTKEFNLWQAKDFNQTNPQITKANGEYAFLVPPGRYYIEVKAFGYSTNIGEVFDVIEGRGVHQNIELKKHLSISNVANSVVLYIIIIGMIGIIYLLIKIRKNILFKRVN